MFSLREQVGYLAYRFDDTHHHDRRRVDYLSLADDILTIVIGNPANRGQLLDLLTPPPAGTELTAAGQHHTT